MITTPFANRLKEIDMFFQGTDPVHQTMRRVTGALANANIPYAVVGGMACNAHNYRRTTADVDLLLTPTGLAEFRRLFVPGDFDQVPGRSRRFVDRTTNVTFDVLLTGLFPGSGSPGPIAFPDPGSVAETIDGINVVNLTALVELKLAAGRYRDFGDVVELIRGNHLDENFAQRLHASVRDDYLECLEEMRREELYEARQDQSAQDGLNDPELGSESAS